MSDEWRSAGVVHVNNEAAPALVRIEGNFHRDLIPTTRDELRDKVRKAATAELLIVDVSDINDFDSWAEGQITDVVDDVVAHGGRAAILHDPDRLYRFRSLEILLEHHQDRVRLGADEAALRAWLAEEAD